MFSPFFGVSSYFLWTQKGLTTLPLVRGSGFVVPFRHVNGFYKYHIITAAHVSCPVRYPQLFSSDKDNNPLQAIGERHISNRLLVPKPPIWPPGQTNSSIFNVSTSSYNLRFQQYVMPNSDVAVLRIENEEKFFKHYPESSVEVDLSPLEDGEEIVLCGVDAREATGNPNDDGLQLMPCQFSAVCKAALVAVDYGTVLLGEIKKVHKMDGEQCTIVNYRDEVEGSPPFPSSLCGGPVLRKTNKKVVGVIVARVARHVPPKDLSKPSIISEPFLNLSDNKEILDKWPLDVAFVPFADFEGSMRRTEL